MLNRYLGNKTDLLDPIMGIVQDKCEPGALICDIFSGSMAVSIQLKKYGYCVAANDINLFSAIIGEALITNNAIPDADINRLIPTEKQGALITQAIQWVESLRGHSGFNFLADDGNFAAYLRYLSVLLFLQNLSDEDVPSDWLRRDIFDTYTELGRNSSFISSRGTRGNRRFFSPDNGHRIDRILSTVRFWWRSHLISRPLYVNILCSLIRAIEKVSNTQGTYHDFPREYFDERALNSLSFEAIPFDVVLTGGTHIVGVEEDSLEFIKRVPQHELIYIDPPYNFRQYTSYYFLPNMICRYPDIPDLDSYFSNVKYVRGQNMDGDFTSTFCKKSKFIESLETLIRRANTRYVTLSYFNGKNHWNDFKGLTNDIGYEQLKNLFTSQLFIPNSLQVIPIIRTNYQSYGGYQASEILEYLFIGEKRRHDNGLA